MRKVLNILLCSLVFFCLCGCSSEGKNGNQNLDFFDWVNQQNNVSDVEKKTIVCPELNKDSIVSGSSEIFISNNIIYVYNMDKLYSNEKNCKEIGNIDVNNIGIAVSNNNAIDNKGNLYNDNFGKNQDGIYYLDTLRDGWKEYFNRFDINENMITGRDVFVLSNASSDDLNYEVLTYTNNGLFAYYIDYMGNNPNGDNIVYKINIDSINDEEILKLYGSIIKTDKAFYTIDVRIINEDKCNKYADIECEKEYYLKKNNVLTKYYDEIMNINNFYIITNKYELIRVDYVLG